MANEVHHRGFGRFTIEDDRGDRRALRIGSGRKALSARQRRAERRAQWLNGTGFEIWDGILFGIAVMLYGIAADWLFANWVQPNFPGAPKFVGTIAAMPILAVFMVGLAARVSRAARIRRPLVNRVLLGSSVCPACIGSLEGVTPTGDGFVVCPHCQSAWSCSRVELHGEPKSAPVDDLGRAVPVLMTLHSKSVPAIGKDDRGRPTAILSGSVSVPLIDAPSSDRQRRLEVFGRRHSVPRVLMYSIATIFVLLALFSMSWYSVPVGIFAALLIYIGVRHEPNRTRSAALSLRLCPSCAEDLEGIPADPNGLVHCPLCEAAWRASDMGERSDTTEARIAAAP